MKHLIISIALSCTFLIPCQSVTAFSGTNLVAPPLDIDHLFSDIIEKSVTGELKDMILSSFESLMTSHHITTEMYEIIKENFDSVQKEKLSFPLKEADRLSGEIDAMFGKFQKQNSLSKKEVRSFESLIAEKNAADYVLAEMMGNYYSWYALEKVHFPKTDEVTCKGIKPDRMFGDMTQHFIWQWHMWDIGCLSTGQFRTIARRQFKVNPQRYIVQDRKLRRLEKSMAE